MALANIDHTAQCKGQAEDLLSQRLKIDAEVYSVVEVGPGSLDVDHVVIFGEKHVGGRLFKAILTADADTCDFKFVSMKSIY